ncbi:MAG: glycosyltransferase, partial [Conexibacter sp.]
MHLKYAHLLADLANMRPPAVVSALITARDAEDVLAATLDSALGQDYPPERLELVVVDDGSADGSAAIADAYARRLPERVRAIHQPQAGPAAALDAALGAARGELLA